MWDETNFLAKGFINEVKGALTESSGTEGGEGFDFGSSAGGFTCGAQSAISDTLILTTIMQSSSATGEITN